MNDQINELLSASEAAKYIKMHEQTFRRLARDGQIPAFKVGGRWKFKKSDLEKYSDQSLNASNRVLIVDDDESIRKIITKALRLSGFMTDSASDGYEALELLDISTPDLIILDLQMPGMTGSELMKRIKEKWPQLPIVVLTGYPESELVSECLEYSPFTLLSKPIEINKLVDLVKNQARS